MVNILRYCIQFSALSLSVFALSLNGISQIEPPSIQINNFKFQKNEVNSTDCDVSWEENGVTFFVTSVSNDISCDFAIDNGEITLYPAKIVLHLDTAFSDIFSRITFDIEDQCGEKCSFITLFDETGEAFETIFNGQVGEPETLIYENVNGKKIIKLTFESMEGTLRYIHFY
jgi:hypothetical protein